VLTATAVQWFGEARLEAAMAMGRWEVVSPGVMRSPRQIQAAMYKPDVRA
jgi:hypothetical protein